MSKYTYEQLEQACDQLRKSERGRRAMENLGRFFREGGIGLDAANQAAVVRLCSAAFTNPWDLPAHLMAKKEAA